MTYQSDDRWSLIGRVSPLESSNVSHLDTHSLTVPPPVAVPTQPPSGLFSINVHVMHSCAYSSRLLVVSTATSIATTWRHRAIHN